MTIIPTSQSDIAEVRDQLTVDYADGKYLNVVSSNLGMQRPPFGFSDATWRALVRVLALQYKQITTKFEAVLSIILGSRSVVRLLRTCLQERSMRYLLILNSFHK
jgi:hypothetical protein